MQQSVTAVDDEDGPLRLRTGAGPSASPPSPFLEDVPADWPPGARVLETARRMAEVNKEVMIGSCWDFVQAVFQRAGYEQQRRHRVFIGKPRGPYADPRLIQPGDWIMHVNLEFGGVHHSAIFVRWLDWQEKVALMWGYAGMKRAVPPTSQRHRLLKVFGILRPM